MAGTSGAGPLGHEGAPVDDAVSFGSPTGSGLTPSVYVPSRADDLDREIGALGDTLSGRGLSPERQAQLAADLSNRLADRFPATGKVAS